MKRKVFFLCTGNSCRSQMAEGFLRQLGGDRYEAYSAGVNPTEVNPLSVKVMEEAGIDISDQVSQSAAEFTGEEFDWVVTVCDDAKQTCPVFPGEYKKVHWDLKDPAEAEGTDEEILQFFRAIRDQIKTNVLEFLQNNT
ncbi:MAG: arsenate reductase ArsC [Candidatus Omnitrophota bacterium]